MSGRGCGLAYRLVEYAAQRVEWAIDSEQWRARPEMFAARLDMGAIRSGKDAARRVMVDEREGEEVTARERRWTRRNG